jgi:hypothetical protein
MRTSFIEEILMICRSTREFEGGVSMPLIERDCEERTTIWLVGSCSNSVPEWTCAVTVVICRLQSTSPLHSSPAQTRKARLGPLAGDLTCVQLPNHLFPAREPRSFVVASWLTKQQETSGPAAGIAARNSFAE